MRKEKLVTIGIIALILVTAGAVIYSRTTGSAVKDIPSEEVAKYIGEHSQLYTQLGCHYCIEQEALFGDNYKYLNVTDLYYHPELWAQLDIRGTPTWVINGEKYIGYKSIEELKELTGYIEF